METVTLHKESKAPLKNKNTLFFKPMIQKKLSVGSANDSYEVEANQDKCGSNLHTEKHLLAHEFTHKMQQNTGIGRKLQKTENIGLCIKSVFGGEVRFNGLNSSELNNIAVINEDDNSGLTRSLVNDVWYNCDGFWQRGRADWFKIPDHCKVNVYGGLSYDTCCNFIASLIKSPPKWVNDDLDSSKSNPFL